MALMPKQVSISELAEELLAHDSFVICGHVSPDGDCLGSELALASALRSLGKQATCLLANADPIDYVFAQLPGMDAAVVAKDFKGDVDTFVSVDVPNVSRMGEQAAALHAQAAFTATIDHHLPTEPMSDVNFIDETSPSTTMLVWQLVKALGADCSAEVASCCYVGLMTDTGRFQFQNTTAAAFAAAGEMVAAGANPSDLARLIYQNRSKESLALEQRMLEHAEYLYDGQFALSHLAIRDFAETGAERPDAEDVIDVLRSVRGVRVACLLREQEHSVRGSLRAKDDTDVAAVARSIGGGGHKAAAGFTFEGSLEEALEALRTVFDGQF